MAGVFYVGATPSAGSDLTTRGDTESILTAGVSRDYVTGRVATLAAGKASKVYVDTHDSAYAAAGYYATKDALLVPNSAKGAANGVASLDSGSKVPVAQVPVLGAGILKGPWGYDSAFGGTTGVTKLKIAQWDIGVAGVTGHPWVFFQTSAQSVDGRSVIDITIGNSATQTSYASQTLIAQGFGRSWYNDYQVITCVPVPAIDGTVPTPYSPATSWVINAWLYDDAGGQSTTSNASIVSGAVFFARTAL